MGNLHRVPTIKTGSTNASASSSKTVSPAMQAAAQNRRSANVNEASADGIATIVARDTMTHSNSHQRRPQLYEQQGKFRHNRQHIRYCVGHHMTVIDDADADDDNFTDTSIEGGDADKDEENDTGIPAAAAIAAAVVTVKSPSKQHSTGCRCLSCRCRRCRCGHRSHQRAVPTHSNARQVVAGIDQATQTPLHIVNVVHHRHDIASNGRCSSSHNNSSIRNSNNRVMTTNTTKRKYRLKTLNFQFSNVTRPAINLNIR